VVAGHMVELINPVCKHPWVVIGEYAHAGTQTNIFVFRQQPLEKFRGFQQVQIHPSSANPALAAAKHATRIAVCQQTRTLDSSTLHSARKRH